MGYYTTFEITSAGAPVAMVIAALVEAKTGYFDESDIDPDADEFRNEDGWKWYDHEQDLIHVSMTLPNVTIRVVGVGENGDHWCKFFLNGQIQRHRASEWVPPAAPSLTGWSPK